MSMFDREDPSRSHTALRRSKSILAVLVSLAVLVGAGWFVFDKAHGLLTQVTAVEDYTGQGTDPVTVTIARGSSVSEMGTTLLDAGVIKSTDAWDAAVKANAESTKIQAGKYRLKKELPAATALDMLLDKANLAIQRVTVPEGLRLSEQFASLSKQTGIPVKQFEAAAKKPGQLGLPGYAKGNPEGLMFPNTYDIDDNAKAAQIMKVMIDEYQKQAGAIGVKDKAKKLGHTQYEVLIVASLIEAEVRRQEDRPKVARVLYNRLDDGMPLQLDTTVMYANNKRHGMTTSDTERANQSPYNTYVHTGLPPGPIDAPGKAALEAAANPAKGDWRYFVVVDPETGETAFAKDKAGHDKNVKKFQDWCQANKGKC